jgi:hypothetical protein
MMLVPETASLLLVEEDSEISLLSQAQMKYTRITIANTFD